MSLERAQADGMAERLRTLAQPQRLMILAVLLDDERAVGEIEAATGIGQPALSQQLAELRRAGLATTRREARQVYYRIADEDAADRVRALFAALGAAWPVVKPLRGANAPFHEPGRLSGAATFARIG